MSPCSMAALLSVLLCPALHMFTNTAVRFGDKKRSVAPKSLGGVSHILFICAIKNNVKRDGQMCVKTGPCFSPDGSPGSASGFSGTAALTRIQTEASRLKIKALQRVCFHSLLTSPPAIRRVWKQGCQIVVIIYLLRFKDNVSRKLLLFYHTKYKPSYEKKIVFVYVSFYISTLGLNYLL